MNARQSEVRERKDKVLGIAVSQYIQTITPVSSAYIVKNYYSDLSSATVRNILADLEQDGYLTHPHTSAGRVPTEKGYRYYVDYLMFEIQLLEEEKTKIKAEYQRESLKLEKLIEKTSQILCDMTHYTSIISIDGQEDKIVCQGRSFVLDYSDIQDIQRIRKILEELERKERLLKLINRDLTKKVNVYIGHEMECANINGCSLVISEYRSKKGLSGRIAVLGPTRMQYDKVIGSLDYVSELMEELL